MISFVVQNFYSNPFLIKTQRYNKLVISMNTHLLFLFIKNNIQNSHLSGIKSVTHSLPVFLLNRFFTKTFFSFFKKLYIKNFGIMTCNLTKSCIRKTFSDLNHFLMYRDIDTVSISHNYSLSTIKYLQPITILSFAFQKKTYDTLMFYILFLLVNNYSSPQNSFKLYYSFVLYPTNFSLYPFLNLFYFKLRQF